MDIPVDLSGFQELLTTLYLRLNGYLTSGFIVHAPENNLTEVDLIGVRFRNNAEPEREVMASAWLQIPDTIIDIVICEVKGGNGSLQFNSPLRTNEHAIASVLRWIGVIQEAKVDETAYQLRKSIAPREKESPEQFKGIALTLDTSCSISIRGVLFAPDRPTPKENQPRFIHGQEMVDFIWNCFCPSRPRANCATRYDFDLWGIYQPLVRYFKDRHHEGLSQGTMKDIYTQFGYHL